MIASRRRLSKRRWIGSSATTMNSSSFISTQINWTLPVGIAQFTGGEDPGHVTLAAAASVSTTLPILVVIIFFQKYLIRGLASGAVKG